MNIRGQWGAVSHQSGKMLYPSLSGGGSRCWAPPWDSSCSVLPRGGCRLQTAMREVRTGSQEERPGPETERHSQ